MMSNFVASRLALVLLVVATVAMTAADEFLETRELQQDIVPESECQVYRDEINDCVSNCSNTNCGPFVLSDDGQGSCLASIYCNQFEDWIACCPECKTPFDEMADCRLGTGRVVDGGECESLCSAASNNNGQWGGMITTLLMMGSVGIVWTVLASLLD